MSQTLKLSVTSNTFKTRVNIYISKIQERNLMILSFTDFDFKINMNLSTAYGRSCTYFDFKIKISKRQKYSCRELFATFCLFGTSRFLSGNVLILAVNTINCTKLDNIHLYPYVHWKVT